MRFVQKQSSLQSTSVRHPGLTSSQSSCLLAAAVQAELKYFKSLVQAKSFKSDHFTIYLTLPGAGDTIDPTNHIDSSSQTLNTMAPSTLLDRWNTFKNWPHAKPDDLTLALAGFIYKPSATSADQVQCMDCKLAIDQWEPHDDPWCEHWEYNPSCPYFIRAKEAAAAAQKAAEQEAAAAAAAAIEAAKPKATAKDIGFFDPTMQVDLWEEFRISVTCAGFLHHLTEASAKYQEKSVRKVISQCLRGPAFKWLKNQPKFTSLNDFKTAIAKAFPAPPAPEPAASTDQVIINPSPQYHRCPQCSMEFSSISRLLNHTQKDCTKITCKHCEQGFSSNNKLHEHVRQHHSQKAAIPQKAIVRSGAPFTPPGSPRLSISSPKLMRQLNTAPLTPPSTPGSTPAIPKPSPNSISMVKAPVACPPSPPPTPPGTPVLSNQEQHTTPKACMTMDELFAMFAGREKESRKSLDTIQKRIRSPMLRQAQAGQPNPTSTNSHKSSISTSCPGPAPRACSPANRSARTPQIAIDAAKSPKPSRKLKSSTLTSCPNSALRPYQPANQALVTPQLADLQTMINANIKQLAWLLRLRAFVSAAPQQWYLAAAAAPIGT